MKYYNIKYKHNNKVQTITIEGEHILKVIADFYDTYGYSCEILIIDCE
jgi:hypothetical protein